MPQTLIELTGEDDAPTLHIMPANGFPPQTYLPLLRPLKDWRAFCLPPRPLWGDELPPAGFRSWSADADDLLAGLARHDLRDVLAVGHSLGGIVSLLALLKSPGTFKALIMLDPVILPRAVLDMLGRAWDEGAVEDFPLVSAALRRRPCFESRDEAFQRFREKSVFADWDEATLRLYVEHGLRRRADEAGFELSWSTAWEAHYFSTVYRDIWRDLPKLNGLAPTLIIRAGHSHTFPEAAYAEARMLLPEVDFYEMAGQGHLFPQAAPRETARIIAEWLASRQLS